MQYIYSVYTMCSVFTVQCSALPYHLYIYLIDQTKRKLENVTKYNSILLITAVHKLGCILLHFKYRLYSIKSKRTRN